MAQSMDRRLPPEILIRVFNLLSTKPIYPRAWSFPPLQVSSYWRQVALSMHHLFTDIQLMTWMPLQLDGLAEWLLRSGSQGLHIQLTAHNISHKELRSGAVGKIFRFLFAYLDRWESLKFWGNSLALTHIIKKLDGASRLKYLSINQLDQDRGPLYDSEAPPTIHLPQLTSFEIIRVEGKLPQFRGDRRLSLRLVELADARFLPPMDEVDRLILQEDVEFNGAFRPRFPNLQSLQILCEWATELDQQFIANVFQTSPLLHILNLELYRPWLSARLFRFTSHIDKLTLTVVGGVSRGHAVDTWSYANTSALFSCFPQLRILILKWKLDRYKHKQEEIDLSCFLRVLCGLRPAGEHRVCPELKELTLKRVCIDRAALKDFAVARKGFEGIRISLEGCFGLPNVTDVDCQGLLDSLETATEVNLSYSSQPPKFYNSSSSSDSDSIL